MRFFLKRIRKSLFGVSPEETTFARRAFYCGDRDTQAHLEAVGYAFIQGYHAALEDDHFQVLVPRLQSIEPVLSGFAFEGAGMGLALLDYFSPWKQRLSAFRRGPGAGHLYVLHVGAGWTLAKLPRRLQGLMAQCDPLLSWLVVDGYGFHQGYFCWRHFIEEQKVPSRLRGYALQAFDQGLGRSLWFVKGADASQIIATIEAFSPLRHADLWSGIGLASSYAGGAKQDVLETIAAAAMEYQPYLAQGASFAAKARQRAGNPAPHTDLACHIFAGCSSTEAARIADESLCDLPQGEQAYEIWRAKIRARLARERV